MCALQSEDPNRWVQMQSKECGNSSEEGNQEILKKERFLAFKMGLALLWKCDIVPGNADILEGFVTFRTPKSNY